MKLKFVDCWFKHIYLARLRNKFLQLILICFESYFWNQLVLWRNSWPEKGSNPWSLGWETDTLTTGPLLPLIILLAITINIEDREDYKILSKVIAFRIKRVSKHSSMIVKLVHQRAICRWKYKIALWCDRVRRNEW
jgi:hypothetical protein